LQEFATACLARAGALVESRGYGLLEAVLPPELAMELGGFYLLLAFDLEVAGEAPGSVLATHGSPVLDRLVALAAGFGPYFALHAPQRDLRPPRDLDGRLAGAVQYDRCRPPRVTRWWTEEHVYWSFCFRAVFRSYERIEELVEVVVEGTTGNVAEDFESLWRTVVPVPASEHRLTRADQLPLATLYQVAGGVAGSRARARARSVQESGATLRDRELAKVRHYHEEIARRINRQLAVTEEPGRRARLEDQLAAILADAGRRAEDTLARYRVEVELTLDHVVAHHLPCLHLKLELAHRDRVFTPTLIYDPLAGTVLAPRCEVCGEPARRLAPDREGRLACPQH